MAGFRGPVFQELLFAELAGRDSVMLLEGGNKKCLAEVSALPRDFFDVHVGGIGQHPHGAFHPQPAERFIESRFAFCREKP